MTRRGDRLATLDCRSLSESRFETVVRQQWDLSCAAASLATVLRYQHGVPVTERSVALGLVNRKEYLANPGLIRIRQGFSLLDLKRFVAKMGFQGIGLGYLAFSDLLLQAPMIVPVNHQGFPHFVVFRRTLRDRVLLADPAFGNVTMPVYKFMNGWIDYKDLGRVGFRHLVLPQNFHPEGGRPQKLMVSQTKMICYFCFKYL